MLPLNSGFSLVLAGGSHCSYQAESALEAVFGEGASCERRRP